MKSVYLFLLLSIIYSAAGQFEGKPGFPQPGTWKKGRWIHPAKRKVSIVADSISYKDLFISIWKQARMHAFFRTKVLDPDIKVKADFNNVPLDSVLCQVLGKRGLAWFYYEETFVIAERETIVRESSERKCTINAATLPDTSGAPRKLKTGVANPEKLWLKPPKLSEVIAYEQNIGSGFYFCEKAGYSDAFPINITQRYPVSLVPLVAERWEAEGHLPIYAEYYYSPDDSVVRTVSYNWQRVYESNFSEDQQDLIEKEATLIRMEEDKRLDFYKSEYARIKALLIRKFGPATDIASNKQAWDKSLFYAELWFVFNPKAHFIRFKLCWKKPETTR